MEGKTEEDVERYAKVFKERYKELNGMLQPMWPWKNLLLNILVCKLVACFIYPAI